MDCVVLAKPVNLCAFFPCKTVGRLRTLSCFLYNQGRLQSLVVHNHLLLASLRRCMEYELLVRLRGQAGELLFIWIGRIPLCAFLRFVSGKRQHM